MAIYDDPKMAGYLSMLDTWMTERKAEAYWTAAQMRSIRSAKPADQREATIAHMTEPGAMTAALNWYRASRGHQHVIEDLSDWKGFVRCGDGVCQRNASTRHWLLPKQASLPGSLQESQVRATIKLVCGSK